MFSEWIYAFMNTSFENEEITFNQGCSISAKLDLGSVD